MSRRTRMKAQSAVQHHLCTFCWSKFYTRQIERRRIYNLDHEYKMLWYSDSHRRLWIWGEEVLHATVMLRYFHVTCNLLMSGGGFSEFVLEYRLLSIPAIPQRSFAGKRAFWRSNRWQIQYALRSLNARDGLSFVQVTIAHWHHWPLTTERLGAAFYDRRIVQPK